MEQGNSMAEDLCPSPYTETIHTLMRIMRRHRGCVERRISVLGIHHSQHHMLMNLARCNPIPSQKELAAAMGISPAAVTATLKRLEKDGYITRTITDEDNRRNEIRITDKGLEKVEESHTIFDSVDRAMFSDFSEEELAAFCAFLERVDANLDAAGAPADTCRKRAQK